ncbi:MAG: S41 family peptidase [Geobacteraceae bacterium]|nr:S41 family peptidase [Geobacteraceae bacterium]
MTRCLRGLLGKMTGMVALGYLLVLCITGSAWAAPELKLFQSVVEHVDKQYVEPPDFQLMLRGAVRGIDEPALSSSVTNNTELLNTLAALIEQKASRTGESISALEVKAVRNMLAALDPHSSLLTPEEYQELSVETKGVFVGIGAEIKAVDAGILIVSPIEDSPAFEAGIKPGDVIEAIDGTETVGMEVIKAVRLLRGKAGTSVILRLKRDSVVRTVTLVRRAINIQSVKYRELGDGVGYLKITQFQERTPQLVEDALYRLGDKGTSKGLVLDLRNNPGGLLNAAVTTADIFVDTGTLLVVKGRASGEQTFSGKTSGTHYLPDVVVLQNKGSASSSEIVSGALRDRKGALIVGEKSFGKGSVQTILPLVNGYAMRLTTAHYYLPSGQSVQAGIEPQIPIEEQEGSDRPLAYAQLALKTGKLGANKRDEVLALLTGPAAAGVAASSKTSPAEPPVIVITAPAIQRGLAVKVRADSLIVSGRARAQRGVARVTVNGQVASLDNQGNFSTELLLLPGENQVVVTALDVQRNATSEQFQVLREAGKPVLQAVAMPKEHGVGSGTYHALLIAVQDYRSSEITRLDHPVQDAERLKNILISGYTFQPAHVTLLKNPDRKTIFKAFESLRRTVRPQDSLLVFFAGHGVWLEDMQQGFWLPRDASGMSDPSDWISNSTLRDYIKAIKARHVLLVADACFAGGIFKVRDAFSRPNAAVEKVFEMPSRKALTSGSLKTVPDRSVFVDYLLKRLNENRDQYLDAQKLYTRFREAVINNSPVSQTPLYGAIAETGDEGGDFIFVRR